MLRPRPLTAIGFVILLCSCTALLLALTSVQEQHLGGGSSDAPRRALAPAAAACVDQPVDQATTCLEQAMWGKCKEPFLAHACDVSCGRCVSTERRRLLQRVLLVSARQHEPCNATAGDFWAMRAQQNKAAFAHAHGMGVTWTSALLDSDYDGAWNKLVLLRTLMRAALSGNQTGAAEPGGERAVRWLLWADWDLIFTDLSFELPLEEYEARGLKLVLGGELKGVYEDVVQTRSPNHRASSSLLPPVPSPPLHPRLLPHCRIT